MYFKVTLWRHSFVIVLDFVLQRTISTFRMVTHEDSSVAKLSDLDFADDIALFDDLFCQPRGAFGS